MVTMVDPDIVVYLMAFIFVSAIVAHLFVLYIYQAQWFFIESFNKRVHRHLDGEYESTINKDFGEVIGTLINKCHYDIYHLRRKYQRRRFDTIKTFFDELFMIDSAAEMLIHDCKKQITYLTKDGPNSWQDIVKFLFNRNPIYNYLFGVFSFSMLNNFLNFLPLFFLGIGIIGGMWEYSLVGANSSIVIYPIISFCFYIVMSLTNIIFNSLQNKDSFFVELGWSFELLWMNRIDDKIINLQLLKPSGNNENLAIMDSQEETVGIVSAIDAFFEMSEGIMAEAMNETFLNVSLEADINDAPPPVPLKIAA